MSVSQECLDKSAYTLKQLAANLRKKVKVMLLGGQNCCDTDRQDMMIYISHYILNKYGNPNPANEDIQVALNDKQVECICNWVSLQDVRETS